MPLKKGSSAAARSANVRELVKSGRPVKQAVAIAYRESGEPATDAEFEEGKHPRAQNGQFGAGGKGEESEPSIPAKKSKPIVPHSDAKKVYNLHPFDQEEPNKASRRLGRLEESANEARDNIRSMIEEAEDEAAADASEESDARWKFNVEHFAPEEENEKNEWLGTKEERDAAWEKSDDKKKLEFVRKSQIKKSVQAYKKAMQNYVNEMQAHLSMLDDLDREEPAQDMRPDSIALDRASVRRIDQDGHLFVERTPISKANVCPYLGKEIPDFEKLGLDPERTYQLYRDPVELAKGAPTFTGKPLLIIHKPVSAGDHPREIVVGSIGDDVTFENPYLMAPLNIWDGEAIRLIQSEEQRELSCGYRYDPDMTPGSVDGIHYDGVMRKIIGNHLALVEEGRAGPDVIVGDSAIVRIDDWISKFDAPWTGLFAVDAEFNESDHPRDSDGKFGGGSHIEPDREVAANRIEPVNEVDPDKVEKIAASMRENGWQGRPVLAYEGANGTTAATGSHRIIAAQEAGIDVPVVNVDDSVLYFEDEDGNNISDMIGTGDDSLLVKFLRDAGDDRSADLVQAEIDANEADS